LPVALEEPGEPAPPVEHVVGPPGERGGRFVPPGFDVADIRGVDAHPGRQRLLGHAPIGAQRAQRPDEVRDRFLGGGNFHVLNTSGPGISRIQIGRAGMQRDQTHGSAVACLIDSETQMT
jgi:hypothetical protein